MGTESAGVAASGADRSGAGSMRHGYPGPEPRPVVRRHLRLFQWIAGAVMVLVIGGFPLLVRPLITDDRGWWPSGAPRPGAAPHHRPQRASRGALRTVTGRHAGAGRAGQRRS